MLRDQMHVSVGTGTKDMLRSEYRAIALCCGGSFRPETWELCALLESAPRLPGTEVCWGQQERAEAESYVRCRMVDAGVWPPRMRGKLLQATATFDEH